MGTQISVVMNTSALEVSNAQCQQFICIVWWLCSTVVMTGVYVCVVECVYYCECEQDMGFGMYMP